MKENEDMCGGDEVVLLVVTLSSRSIVIQRKMSLIRLFK